MPTRFELLKDRWGFPVQGLAPDPTGSVTGAITATSVAVALPADTDMVRFAANQPCYFAFGTSGVTADGNSSLFPAGSEIFRVPPGSTHVAVIRDGTVSGAFSITRMI